MLPLPGHPPLLPALPHQPPPRTAERTLGLGDGRGVQAPTTQMCKLGEVPALCGLGFFISLVGRGMMPIPAPAPGPAWL